MKPCCSDWIPQCEKINGPIVLHTVRSGFAHQYDGIPFRFCPWCGAPRPLDLTPIIVEDDPYPDAEVKAHHHAYEPSHGTKLAEELRDACNGMTAEEQDEAHRRGMRIIYGGFAQEWKWVKIVDGIIPAGAKCIMLSSEKSGNSPQWASSCMNIFFRFEGGWTKIVGWTHYIELPDLPEIPR